MFLKAGVNKVNKNFESKNADPAKLLDDLLSLLNSLVSKITAPNSKFNVFHDNIEILLIPIVISDTYLKYKLKK